MEFRGLRGTTPIFREKENLFLLRENRNMKYFTIAVLVLAVLVMGIGCATRPEPVTVTVTLVKDGDSFVMSNDNEIRLLGIDAPEWNEPGGDIAKAYLEGLILGKELRFEKGEENKDDYNRLLRYTYEGKTFINAEMVATGYAICRYDSKEKKYKAQMRQLQKDAEEYKRGLWAFGNVFQTTKPKAGTKEKWISWEQADKYIGETKTVEGTITSTSHSDKICQLYFADKNKGKFRVIIFAESYAKFPDVPWKYYSKKRIRVTGLIKQGKDSPELEVKDPEQIEIMK